MIYFSFSANFPYDAYKNSDHQSFGGKSKWQNWFYNISLSITFLGIHLNIYKGEPANKIVPYHIKLEIQSSKGQFLCGGTLLSETHVLTARHCLEITKASPRDVFLIAGYHNLTNNDDQQVSYQNLLPIQIIPLLIFHIYRKEMLNISLWSPRTNQTESLET